MICRWFGLILCLIPTVIMSHGGRVDSTGGHNDRKQGGYHCHKEPCFSLQTQTAKATQSALKESTPVSLIYNRKDWKHWSDFDRDCMNTRHEILQDQSIGKVTLSHNGCSVSSGKWYGLFSGNTYTKSSDLDIDHIIPLKWAHEHGGANWSKSKKEQYANDPVNLLAVDDGLNQSKGAKGPSQWMPPRNEFRCEYLTHWSIVLKKYQLTMTVNERKSFQRYYKRCH